MSKTAIQQNSWQEVKLGEVAVDIIDNRGRNPSHYVKNGIPVIDNFLITGERKIYLKNAKRFIDEEIYNNFIRKHIQAGDVLITLVGNGYGNIAIAPKEKSVIIQNTIGLRTSNSTTNTFLFYWLSANKISVLSLDRGAVQPSVKVGDLKELSIFLPPLPEQKAIAEVLSSLDDKIDLLHRQNKTLEDTAQVLFRKWFVDEADEGWEEKRLGEVVDIINGYSYKGKELVADSSVALVTLKNFGRDGTFQKRGFKPFIGSPKETQEVQKGDLIVAHTDLTQNADVLGNPALVFEDGGFEKLYITMDLVKVEPKDNNISKSFLYFLMKTIEFKSHCVGYANGSTVLHLSKKAIPDFAISLPSDFEKAKNKIQFFDDVVSKIAHNQSQIRTLENLRNTLLPKLMSGEVRVKLS